LKPKDYLVRELYARLGETIEVLPPKFDQNAQSCSCKIRSKRVEEDLVRAVAIGPCGPEPWLANFKDTKVAPCYAFWMKRWWLTYIRATDQEESLLDDLFTDDKEE
jgi:hypothetical protein